MTTSQLIMKVDKGTEERISVCLIKSGLNREDLPEDLDTITYPVSKKFRNLSPKLITQTISVRIHVQQERSPSPSCCGGLFPLVPICQALWPKWENGRARNKSGKNLSSFQMQCNILFVFRKLPARPTAPSSELLPKMTEVVASPQLTTAVFASNCLRFTQIFTLSQVSIWTDSMWFFTAAFFENMRWHWTQLELFHQSISLTFSSQSLVLSSCASSICAD